MRAVFVYLLRFLLSVVACAALLVGLLAANHITVWQGDYLLSLLSLLDVFHHLFYAGIFVVVIGALLGSWRRFVVGDPSRAPGRLTPLVAAVLLAALPIAAVQLARPGAAPTSWFYSGSLYVALNFWLFFRGSALVARDPRWGVRIRRAVLLADALAPLLVWAAYREREPRRLRGWQILPLLLVVSMVFIPWVVRPRRDPEFTSVPHAAMRPIYYRMNYQVEVDPADGLVITCDNNNHLYKIDPASGKVIHEATLEPVQYTDQGFGVDEQTREIGYVDSCTGHWWVFDETDLHLKRTAAIENYREHQTNDCRSQVRWNDRTLWSAASGLFVSFTYQPGLQVIGTSPSRVLFDLGDFEQQTRTRLNEMTAGLPHDAAYRRVMAGEGLKGFTADALIEPGRRRVHWVTITPTLNQLDFDRRLVERILCLPSLPDRIALDAKHNRLFVTLPIIGQVLVVDATDYHRIAAIHAFPGVRTVTVDAKQDRLYLGGFSPLLEIRSLTDFSPQDRIVAPAWIRWVAVDARRNKAYVSANSGNATIWELDLLRLRQDRWGAFWRRIDPFYPIMRILAELLRTLIMQFNPNPTAFGALTRPPPIILA